MNKKKLSVPISAEDARALKIGDVVYIKGKIFTARDMAHLKLRGLYENGEPMPVDLNGGVIFHAGPVAFKDGNGDWILNVIGPTTSIRMEPHADIVGKWGVKIIIGKGGMADDTLACCSKYGYVYLQAAPGCAALLADGIEKINGVNYLELGMPEAVWELEASEFGPLVVAMDTHNKSIYNEIKESAAKIIDRLYPAEAD